jgi:acyl transferase domain-containing protein/3-hydroxymyristoyl/3-hydroxydecanoyl-(acyl carrier protein) dehydratase
VASIAITGISCLFPGSQAPDGFYQSLLNHETFLDSDFLYEIRPDHFDVPVDQEHLDRLDEINTYTLYVVQEALKDSRCLDDGRALEKTGLIVGNRETVNHKTFDLFKPLYFNELETQIQQLLGNSKFHFNYTFDDSRHCPLNAFHFSYPTLFAARTLGLKGPAFAVEAACASSIYAIKLACEYLLTGQVDTMVAGGVFFGKRNKALPYYFDKLGVTPEGGDSRPFDRDSGGMIANEGGGAVVLKRLNDALRDQNTIYAVIEEIGWSNDGSGKNLLAPSQKGQIATYQNAYNPDGSRDIDYIECHATGTQTGDLVELNSLEAFFGQNDKPPYLGALKGNIGHLLTASGMAGLIKVLCSMKHGTIPATVNVTSALTSANGYFSGDTMVLENKTWPQIGAYKRAGINAFGFGGINAHMRVKEYVPRDGAVAVPSVQDQLPETRLSITGIGIHYGDIQNKSEFADALFFGKHPGKQKHAKRLRGLEKNKRIAADFLGNQALPDDYYFSSFDFDFFKNKVHTQAETEALNKELLMLNVASAALEDAGFKKGPPRNVAVIISTKQSLFQLHFYLNAYLPDFIREALKDADISLDEERIEQLIAIARNAMIPPDVGLDVIATGIGPIIATRIASVWNFTGPVYKLCDLENSFARSIELTRLLMQDNSIDAVLLGAIDADPLLESLVWYSKYGNAHGLDLASMKFAEGAAAVVIQPSDRIRDDDANSYADIESVHLVRETPAVHSPLAFPSPDRFVACFQETMTRSDLSPAQIGYLELGGNCLGAPPNEHLKKLDDYLIGESDHPVLCGGAFLNFGYSPMTSQAVSIVKTALMLKYGFVPPIPRIFAKPFQAAKNRRLAFPTASSYWLDTPDNKKGLVYSAGFCGTCTQTVLCASSPKRNPDKLSLFNNHHPFVIANQDLEHLKQDLNGLKEALSKEPSLFNLAQTTYRSYNSKAPSEKKYTVVLNGDSRKERQHELERALEAVEPAVKRKTDWWGDHGSYFTGNPLGAKGKVALVYPPTGFNSSPNTLYEMVAAFEQLIPYLDHVVRTARPGVLDNLRRINRELERDDTMPLFMDGIVANLVNHTLLAGLNVSPDVFIGCSFGELLMYVTTEVLIEEEETDFIEDLVAPLIARLADGAFIKRYFKDDTIEWVTYLCKSSPENIKKLMNHIEQSKTVFATIKGSPKNVIVSGNKTDCERLFKRSDCFAYQISRDICVHTPLAMTFYDDVLQSNFKHPFRIQPKSGCTYYRTFAQSPFQFQKREFASTMADCICRPVDFEGIILKAYRDGVRTFISVDTSNICTNWVADTLADKDALVLSIKQSNRSFHASVDRCRTQLISHGLGSGMELFAQRPLEKSPARHLIKTISNAPPSISDAMVTEAHLKIFQPSQRTDNGPGPSIPDKADGMIDDRPQKNETASVRSAPPPADTPGATGTPAHILQKLFEQNVRVHRSYIDVQTKLVDLLERSMSTAHGGEDGTQHTVMALQPPKQSKIRPHKRVIWDAQEVKEMTLGRLSKVLGPKYAQADTYATRLRMPLPPYLFVNRVTDVDVTFGELKPSMIEVEHDFPEDAWYAYKGIVPYSILNEASQCGILLLSIMGVDVLFKGKMLFRAIGSTVTVVSEKMLRTGETAIGRFKIVSFLKTKELMIANFIYDLFDADDTHIFSVKGTGGLVSRQELEKVKGIQPPPPEPGGRQIKKKAFAPILSCDKSAFSHEDITHLQKGRSDLCFGPSYPVYDAGEQIYPNQFRIVDRIRRIDATGGPFGLGRIIGEADIDPNHWIFDAHFKDDPVLPATFMVEGGIQLLSFYIHFLGLKKLAGPDTGFGPVSKLGARSKFLAEVKREKTTLRYECDIKQISMEPHITVISNLAIFNADRMVAQTDNLGIKLKEREQPHSVNRSNTLLFG